MLSLTRAMRRARRRVHDDEGETLIELLVTVFLMGTAIVAILTTFIAVIVSSSGHRRRVQAANEATTVVEAIDRLAYVPCAQASDFASALTGLPDGYTVAVTAVRYLEDGDADTATYPTSITRALCQAAGDQGSQEIDITVTSPGTYVVTYDLTIVKRNDTCPTDPATVAALDIAPGDRC